MFDCRKTEEQSEGKADTPNGCFVAVTNGELSIELKCDKNEQISNVEKNRNPRQRQKRTNFSLFQRHELERAFSQCQYLTPQSSRWLHELGIPKQNIKVWFKNRRVKWRKEMRMRNWCLSEKKKIDCLQNSLSHPVVSPNKWSHLQPATDLYNEVKTTECPALVLKNNTLPQSLKSVGSLKHNGGNMLGGANPFYDGNSWLLCANAGVSQNHHQLQNFTETDALYNGSVGVTGQPNMMCEGSVMRDATAMTEGRVISQGEVFGDGSVTSDATLLRDDSLMFDSSVIRDACVMGDGNLMREPNVMLDANIMRGLTAMPQNQISYPPNLPWIQISPDIRGSMYRIHEADQILPEQNREGAYNQLQDFESVLDELMTIIAEEQLATENRYQLVVANHQTMTQSRS